MFYLIFLLFFTLFTILFAYEDAQSSLSDVYGSPLGKFRIWVQVMIIPMLLYFVWEEAKQLFVERTRYFAGVWNYLDILGYLLVIQL